MTRQHSLRRERATAVEIGRIALGVRHLVAARRDGVDHVEGRPTGATVGFYWVLGVRQVAQGVLLIRAGSPEAHTLGAAVDTVHAISMVPLMIIDRRRRSIAASQFFIAIGLAILEALLVGKGGRRRTR